MPDDRRHLTDSGSIPVDPDVEVDESPSGTPARPVHLRWSYVGLVALGGAVGTAARAALADAFPAVDGVAWIIFGINLLGAFCLGLLLEALARSGPDEGGRRTARLLLGTGVLGGFTTYSTLATGTAQLLMDGRLGSASVYSLASVVGGLAAVVLGLWAAVLVRPRRARSGADVRRASSPAQPEAEGDR
jgi:fluoride exporter